MITPPYPIKALWPFLTKRQLKRLEKSYTNNIKKADNRNDAHKQHLVILQRNDKIKNKSGKRIHHGLENLESL